MSKLLAGIAFLALVFSQVALAATGVRYFDLLEEDENGFDRTLHYRVAVLKNRPDVTAVDDETESLIARADAWRAKVIRNAYAHYSPSVLDKLQTAGLDHDPRFTRIIVLKPNAAGGFDVVGTLKLIYDNGVAPLPVDELFKARHPRPKFANAPIELLDPHDGGFETISSAPVGSMIQVMEFAVEPGTDVAPILHYLAEVDLVQRAPGNLGKARAGDGSLVEAYPSEYVLYCDQRLVPYYRWLGFELTPDPPYEGSVYKMVSDRKHFVDMANKRFRTRGGYKLLEAHGIIEKFYKVGVVYRGYQRRESLCSRALAD